MPRPSARKAFAPTLALSLVMIFAAACSPGAEKAPANTAANNVSNSANASGAANTSGAAGASATPAAAAGQAGATRAKVNLNTASREEFIAAVPNLGNKMAHEFEEYRPYKSIQQFRKEIGKYVPAEKVAEYERYVFVPVSENDSDAETLRQIPGLDAAEAAALVAARPYASREAFLSKLAEKVSAEELAAARNYLAAR